MRAPTLREAAQAALDVLTRYCGIDGAADFTKKRDAIDALCLALAAQPVPDAGPVAWLCELSAEDGSTHTQFVTEDPGRLRWNDGGEPSPFRVTMLYAAPVSQQAVPEQKQLK